jgi:LuxR family maltose regulon positive regulatory protein
MGESTEQSAYAGPLLETKLYAPRWRPGLVSRPRLIERLIHGSRRKLTLISAPPGFGKTTLLAEWLAAAPAGEQPAAWVSLDENDNDPALFWAYFIAALQKVQSGVGESTRSQLNSPEPPPVESVLTALINEINATSHDFVLILDDFHVIDARPVHDAIAFLIEHLPPQMRLVISSRAVPLLPLSRLRGRGELTELRAADLRFTPNEAAAFLNQVMGLDLSATDVAALDKRIEGWIAGLQLAALTMQGREDVQGFIRTFAGDDRYIVDYLVEEVLQRQPEHVRSFLLQTSILERLCGPLCDAVTGSDDGNEMLATLEQGNLFVVPLDDKRQWYRYHHLFADVLRAHLMEAWPGRIPALRSRAALWFEQRNMPAEAIEHARAAGDHETVARLLVANFDEFERTGHYASLASWCSSLPEEMVRNRPRLALVHALSAWRSESHNATARRLTSWAEDAVREIESHGGLAPQDDVNGTFVGPEGLDALKGELLVLKIFHSSRQMPEEEMEDTVSRALELLPARKSYIRGMVHMANAGLQAERRGLPWALSALDTAAEEARKAQNLPLLSSILEHRGNVSAEMGLLDEARRSYEGALDAGSEASPEASWMMCGPYTGLAGVALERGDLAGATDHVMKALELTAGSPMRSYVLFARTAAIAVFLAAGDVRSAREQLEKAEAFVQGASDSRHASYISAVKLKLYCGTGDLEAAARVVRDRRLSLDSTVDHGNEEEMTAYARYLIARGDCAGAAQVLSNVLPVVQKGGRTRHEVHALVLHALACELLSERALALKSLGRATMLGEPGQLNRTFTSEGPVITGLLEALADAVRRGRGPAETGPRPYLDYLLREAGVQPGSAPATARLPQQDAPRTPSLASLPEAMSDRELEVLTLIASGASNQQIAEHLVVSMSTVKSHINRIYRKLGARSRTQAVAMGRQLGIL